MVQKMLFGSLQTKGSKRADNKLVKQAKPKKAEPITYVTGNKFKDIVIQAKSMSHKILGDILNRLELVTDEERLSQYIANILKTGVYSIDTETSGLLPYYDVCAGICLYTPGETGIYVPLNHMSQMTHQRVKKQITPEFMSRQLRRLIRKDTPWVGHNCKFEMNVCYWQLNVRLNAPMWDTLPASVLLNENESHSLKYQHVKYVQGDEDKQTAKFNSLFQGIPFPLIPPDVAYMYASYDPLMTYELYKFQEPYLTETNEVCKEFGLEKVAWYYHTVELPLIEVLFDMEAHGVKLDIDAMHELSVRFTAEMENSEAEFKQLVSEYQEQFEDLRVTDFSSYQKLELDEKGNVTVSISSPTQLAILFYDILKLTSSDKKKPRGTGVDVLKSFELPIAEVILKYRKFSKLVTTYLNMDEFQAKGDGRVHTNYNANGARTGRLSSDKPNLQNIPARSEEGKLIRKMFVASDGNYIIGSDYSQQEPRILAYFSKDENMIDAYLHGRDLYATIGATLYKVPYEECLEFYPDGSPNKEGGKRRNNVKSVLLGLMYGRQSKSIAQQMKVSVKEAENVIKNFFKTFPKVGEFITFVQNMAATEGYVETLGGRKCRLPDMTLDTYEFQYIDESKSATFNPLDFSGQQEASTEVPEHIVEEYWNLLDRAWGFKKKQEIIEKAKNEGILIKDNGGKIADAERQCLNSVVQGSAAVMSKYAMVQVAKDKKLNDLGFHLMIPVHDELLGEVPVENAKEASERLSEIMIASGKALVDTVPMKCDPSIVERWYGEEISL